MFGRVLNIRRFQVHKEKDYTRLHKRVAQDSKQNAPLEIFHRVLNMPIVLKWQGYKELRILCKLYSRD